MKIVAIANQKGGVGKTTTSVNLAACLAEDGHRILLVDLDPQANATSALGFAAEEGDSLYECLVDPSVQAASKIVQTAIANLELIPAHLELAGAEIDLARQGNHWSRLREVLEPLASLDYEYCFLDCPPSLGILMTAALATAHDLLIPVQCEYFSMQGLLRIQDILETLRQSGANPNGRLEGIVLTMYDSRTRLARSVIEDVRQYFPAQTYDTVIPRSVKLGEAPSHCLPIIHYDPSGAGAAAYRALAGEFVDRRSRYRIT
ncbi:MAG TPA: ParA family protein [Verrucomicrobiales bacterium]|nr:ParA family protein [Verrucomicrobiales bacterium]